MLASGVNVNWPLLGIPAIWEKMMKLTSRNLTYFYESLLDFLLVGIKTIE